MLFREEPSTKLCSLPGRHSSHIVGEVGFSPDPGGLEALHSQGHQWFTEAQELLARGWVKTQLEQGLAARAQQGGQGLFPGRMEEIRNNLMDRRPGEPQVCGCRESLPFPSTQRLAMVVSA